MNRETTSTPPKERLIEAGIRLFGELNGHEVSNRLLASEADVNHAMINYHFGSRDGLCEAIFDHAIKEWSAVILPIFERTERDLAATVTKNELEPIVRRLIPAMIEVVTGRESSKFLAVLLNEDLTTPARYFDRLFSEVLAPFHTLAARIAAMATGKPENSLECFVLGQTIVAQCMTFFRGRVLLLRKSGQAAPDKEKIAVISRVVSDSVVAALGL